MGDSPDQHRVPRCGAAMKRKTRTRVTVAAGAVLAVVGAVLWAGHRPPKMAVAVSAVPEWGPLPHVVAVEVLNAGMVPGVARTGTDLLRDAGFDVKYFGNAEPGLDTIPRNRILVRRGDTTGVGRLREVLGGADVEIAPSEAPLVDLTVLLARTFRPARLP